MVHHFTRFFFHFIWATWEREPLITAEIEPYAYRLIKEQSEANNCQVIALGGIADHVHLFIAAPPTFYAPDLMKSVKGVSSHRLNEAYGRPGWAFKWQSRYSGHTVSAKDVLMITGYIEKQKRHHADGTLIPNAELPSQTQV